MSHTITLPSLAPVAKMTDKETYLIQFEHYHVTEKLFSTFEANLFHYHAEHYSKDTLQRHYQLRSNSNKNQQGDKTWEMKIEQEFFLCHVLLS